MPDVSKAYPRRRDVRERLFAIYEILDAHFDPEEMDFNTEFLTDVRDLMRAGADVESSILASMPEAEPVEEVSEEELAAFIDELRAAAMLAAGVPEEDQWDPPEDDGEEGSDYNYDY